MASSALSLSVDPERPSFFELLQKDQLDAAVKPALEFVSRILAESNPNLDVIYRRRHEIYAVLRLVADVHFLSTCDGTFSEYFFSIKRERASGPGTIPLSARSRIATSLVLVILPMLASKLDDAERESEAFGGPHSPDEARPSPRQRFLRLWPRLRVAAGVLRVLYMGLFAVGATRHWSPLGHALGLVPRRLTPRDMAAHSAAQSAALRQHLLDALSPDASLATRAAAVASLGWRVAARASLAASVAAVLGFKVLEWWFSRDTAERRAASAAAARVRVPPPAPLPCHRRTSSRRGPAFCPLCDRRRRNDACTAAGVLCCFACLRAAVAADARCPFTALPCTPDGVRRVFLPAS